MSFKREGNDNSLLNLLRKRRISELHSLDISENEAFLMKNGRFACMVCHHRPIFDTVQVLNLHRNSKKHMAAQGSTTPEINFPSPDKDNYQHKKIKKFSTGKDYDDRQNLKNETKEIKKRKKEQKELICNLIDKAGVLADLVDHKTALLAVKPYQSKQVTRTCPNTLNNTNYPTKMCTTASINSIRSNDNELLFGVSNIKSNVTHDDINNSFPWNISNSRDSNKISTDSSNHLYDNSYKSIDSDKKYVGTCPYSNDEIDVTQTEAQSDIVDRSNSCFGNYNNNNHNNNNHDNNPNNKINTNNNHNNKNNTNNNHNNNNHNNNNHNKDNKTNNKASTQKPKTLTETQNSVYLKALQAGWVRDRCGGWVKDATVEFDTDDDENPPQFNTH